MDVGGPNGGYKGRPPPPPQPPSSVNHGLPETSAHMPIQPQDILAAGYHLPPGQNNKPPAAASSVGGVGGAGSLNPALANLQHMSRTLQGMGGASVAPGASHHPSLHRPVVSSPSGQAKSSPPIPMRLPSQVSKVERFKIRRMKSIGPFSLTPELMGKRFLCMI